MSYLFGFLDFCIERLKTNRNLYNKGSWNQGKKPNLLSKIVKSGYSCTGEWLKSSLLTSTSSVAKRFFILLNICVFLLTYYIYFSYNHHIESLRGSSSFFGEVTTSGFVTLINFSYITLKSSIFIIPLLYLTLFVSYIFT